MSELTTSSFQRLYSTAQHRLRETMADNLAATIDDLECKRQDAIAQEIIDQIVIIAQGRDPAADRLQDVVNFCLSLDYDDGEDEEDARSSTVITNPKMNDTKE